MKQYAISFFSIFLLLTTIKAQDKKALMYLSNAVKIMGGSAWDTVHSLSFKHYGYRNAIEQSERPEGPFVPEQLNTSEIRDFRSGIIQLEQKMITYNFVQTQKYTINDNQVFINSKNRYLPLPENQMMADETVFGPETVLQKASKANDLTYLKDSLVQGSYQHIIKFTSGKIPVRIFINKETGFLTAVELFKPYSNDFMDIWGDSKKTTYYSFWNLVGKNLHYPLQADIFVNGWHYSSTLINEWQLNPLTQSGTLKIPDSARTQVNPTSRITGLKKSLDQRAKEISPGIWLLPGPCNSTVVDQGDGLVLIEASLNSEYGELLMNKALELFPGKKIKAVVSTSDAWLHIGGLRPFAGIDGIKIYYPKKNDFIIKKLLGATYITNPDKFSKQADLHYQLNPVIDSTVLGTGKNKIILYTFQTETGERMMMTYFPNQKRIYASDLYQPKDKKGDYWNPHIAWEVLIAVQRRKLSVDSFYGMHTPDIIPFQELTDDFK